MNIGDIVIYMGDEYEIIKIDYEDSSYLLEDNCGYRLWVDFDKVELPEGG